MATIAEIQQLYIIYLGRPADPNGLDFWLSKTSLTAAQIANAFGSTPEYQQRLADLGTAGAINQIYRNVFGRSPEPAGLQFWTQKVQTGELSLATAGFVITNSATGVDITTRDNKQASATLYTANVRLSTQAILAYDTTAGLNAGVSYLTGITTTAATEAQAATAANTMTTSSGGGSGGLTFNAIAANAVLTNAANTNGAGTGPGFTPSASTLSNSNDIIRVGVFGGATIQDLSTTDNDTLILDSVGFAQGVAAVAGVETLSFNGAASFSAGNIGGVQTVNFTKAGNFGFGLSQANTANFIIATTGTVGLTGNASQAVLNVALSAANAGTLSLNATTSLNITNSSTANTSYTLNFTAAAGGAGSLQFAAGTANTAFALNLRNTANNNVAFSGATFTNGGDFTLDIISNGNSAAALFGNTDANIVTFGSTGNVTVIDRGHLTGSAQINHLGWSGVSAYQFSVTAGGRIGDAASGVLTLNAAFKGGELGLSFGTAAVFTALNGPIFQGSAGATGNSVINSAAQVVFGNGSTAFFATGLNDTLSFTINSLSGIFQLGGATAGGAVNNSGSIQLAVMDNTVSGFTAFTAGLGVERFNLNIFGGSSSQTHFIQDLARSTATTTFGLNAANAVAFSLTAAYTGISAYTTFAFSQADGDNSINVNSAMLSFGRFSLIDGSGNSFIRLANLATAQSVTAGAFGALGSAAFTSLNFIDITDGGDDTINVGMSSGFSAIIRASIAGLGAGDVLSFTQYVGSIFQITTITAYSAFTAAGLSAIALYFDGANTFVFQNASAADDAGVATANSVAAVLVGNYANVARWSLNGNNLVAR